MLRFANTDNKGKLFVMLFAWLCVIYKDLLLNLYLDTLPAPILNPAP